MQVQCSASAGASNRRNVPRKVGVLAIVKTTQMLAAIEESELEEANGSLEDDRDMHLNRVSWMMR